MQYNPAVEEALRAMIEDAHAEYERERERHRSRMASIREGLELAVAAQGIRFPADDMSRLCGRLLLDLPRLGDRALLRRWADAHDGTVVMKDLVSVASTRGRFTERKQAHRSLWASMSQAVDKGEFVRREPGIYERRKA